MGSLVLSSTMEIEQSLTAKSNSRCAFQCCIVKNVNVVFPAVRPCCLEKTKQQNKMWKNAKLYFRRISAIHCDFLTSNQTINVNSDGMVNFDNTNIYFCFLHLSRIWLSCWHWPVGKTGDLDLEVCCPVVGHNSMAAAQHHPLTALEVQLVDSDQFGVKKKKIHSHNITQLKTCSS